MEASEPLHILVVEDDPSAADVIALVLRKRLSAQVSIASSCMAARKLFSEGHFDLVTIDYNLPDGSGIDLLTEFAATSKAPPIIVVTGHGDEETAARCVRAGAAGYVIKDESLSSTLLPAIDRGLELSRAESALRESELRYRRIFETATNGIMLLDAETGQIADINPRFVELLGHEREKLEGQRFWEAGFFEDAGLARTLFDDSREGILEIGAQALRTKQGKEIRADIACEPYVEGAMTVIRCSFHDVTERWALEEELRSSEERYRTLFENMIEGVSLCRMLYDDEGRPSDWVYLETNRAFGTITGLEDVKGKRVSDVIGGIRETNPELFEIYGKVARTGEPASFETRVDALGVDFSVKVASPSQGLFVAVFDDITERRKGERALARSEAKYRFLAEQMKDIAWTSDLKLNTTYVSPSVHAVLGYDEATWMGMKLESQITSESLCKLAELLSDELTQDAHRDPSRTEVIELCYRNATGGEVWLETSISFIRGVDGIPVGIYGLARDVTERKAIQRALEESEELFRQISEVSNDAIVVLDSTGHIAYWNPGAERISGYEGDEVLGRNIGSLLSRREDVEENARKFQAFMGREKQMPEPAFELMIVNKAGQTIPVAISSAAFVMGGERRLVVNVRDMTERVRAEETIRRNAEDLRDLVDVAAHELRHPATIFKGYASILMRYGDQLESEVVQDALEAIDRGADRLSMLINKLLDTSRVERGGIVPEFSEVDPWDLARSALAEALADAPENELVMIPRSQEWTCRLDRSMTKEVLAIIIDNAIKHTPEGTKVEIACERGDSETVFSISDTGPGIPEQAREMIFERFYQIEDASHHSKPGLGLGLYIAKNYVEAQGGWIRMEPRKDGGSVFRFSIPDDPYGSLL